MLEVRRKAQSPTRAAASGAAGDGAPAAEIPDSLEELLSKSVIDGTRSWAKRHALKRDEAGKFAPNLEVSRASSGDKEFLTVAVLPHFL